MSRKVYEVSFYYNDTKKWEVKGCFDSQEVAHKYAETAASTDRKNINMTMIKPVDLDLRDQWKILHDDEGLIWVAYNKETLTTHLLQDQTEDVWDPCPAVPQPVIEMFWDIKARKGMYPKKAPTTTTTVLD